MRKIGIFIFTIVGASLMIGLPGCSAALTLNTDAEKVAAVAMEIADLILPVRYTPEFTLKMAGYTVVSFRADDQSDHLYLIQSDHEADGEKLQQMLAEMTVGSTDPQAREEVIETRSILVRDQETTLVISDCVNSEGHAYRQAEVVFQGKGGPTLFVFSNSFESWDEAELEAILASIQ